MLRLDIERGKMNNPKILMVIAPKDFQGREYGETKREFIEHGFKVVTASERVGECIEKFGSKVMAEVSIGDINPHDYEAIVFIGGPGAADFFHYSEALHLAKEAFEAGKIVGAICIAPTILANADILRGKNVTAFETEKEKLQQKGANFTGKEVEVDGNIVTANGPEASEEFAEEIAKLIS